MYSVGGSSRSVHVSISDTGSGRDREIVGGGWIGAVKTVAPAIYREIALSGGGSECRDGVASASGVDSGGVTVFVGEIYAKSSAIITID